MQVMTRTTPFVISEYIAYEASGSDISNPNAADSGYSPLLARELHRLGVRKGTLHLDAEALRDLAEYLDTVALGARDDGNAAGVRSCYSHQDRALEAARRLDLDD